MRGELKSIFVFPLSLFYVFGFRIGPKDVVRMDFTAHSLSPHLSLCSSERLSFLLVWSHTSLSAFGPITPICLICVWVVIFLSFFGRLCLCLTVSVTLLYLCACTRSYCRFIHVCVLRCIIVLPVFLVPFSLASLCFSLSRFLQYFLFNHWSSTSG